MKKTLLIATAALLLLATVSCNKDQDGVYNPKQKISKIYESGSRTYNDGDSNNTPRHLSEQWEWDGNLLNSRTILSSSGSISDKYTYTYEKKRLVRIDYTAVADAGRPTEYTTFSYDGKELVQADHYYDNRHEESVRFTHTDGKITAIDITYAEEKGSTHPVNAMLSMLLPPDLQMNDAFRQMNAKNAAKNAYVTRLEVSWTGNNISMMRMTYDDYTQTCAFTYDDKKNPYYGMCLFWLYIYDEVDEMLDSPEYASVHDKNNVLTASYSDSDYHEETCTFTYTYKNDYPETCTVNRKRSRGGGYIDYGYTGIDRYEYEYLK